jgi:hypothetical protein
MYCGYYTNLYVNNSYFRVRFEAFDSDEYLDCRRIMAAGSSETVVISCAGTQCHNSVETHLNI